MVRLVRTAFLMALLGSVAALPPMSAGVHAEIDPDALNHVIPAVQIAPVGSAGAISSDAKSVAQQSPVPWELASPDPLFEHIDRFWEARFLEAGREYDPPSGVVGFDEPIVTACGRGDPEREAAFYCVIDEKIYYSMEFRSLIKRHVGDFAWVYVIAYGWSQHIQARLGFDPSVGQDSSGGITSIELALQADCLVGAYAIDAETAGMLAPRDIDEALDMAQKSGDPPGTRTHGTDQERVEAFLIGYRGRFTACNLDLTRAPLAT